MTATVVFVDDDVAVLQGLRRLLFRRLDGWDTHFCTDPKVALGVVRERVVDLVVTDVRMPGMDGVEFLREVRAISPSTLRFVLSGFSEYKRNVRFASIAHRFFAKPCCAEDLALAIEDGCDIKRTLDSPAIQSVVGAFRGLPCRERAYRQLTEVVASADAREEILADHLLQMPTLAARVLQLCNSHLFGGQRCRVVTMKQAVNLLGIGGLKSLVLVIGSSESGAHTNELVEELEQHSLLSRLIALQILGDDRRAEEAAMCALLHDIGAILLASEMAGEYASIVRRASERGVSRCTVEREALGSTHSEIGAALLGVWGLPLDVVRGVAYHHAPSRAGERELGLAGVCHIADCLAHEAASAARATPSASHEPNEEYILSVGVADHLPAWRRVAYQLAARVFTRTE